LGTVSWTVSGTVSGRVSGTVLGRVSETVSGTHLGLHWELMKYALIVVVEFVINLPQKWKKNR
jgi:hypothetical protein